MSIDRITTELNEKFERRIDEKPQLKKTPPPRPPPPQEKFELKLNELNLAEISMHLQLSIDVLKELKLGTIIQLLGKNFNFFNFFSVRIFFFFNFRRTKEY